MYAVGRLGSYISRGVYTVSGPFHPFGGAVDIIVVEQQDGSFKSSPWYVRFGKFQGVLKSKEKVVSISVDGIEADFHMYLDNKGEAYFLREVEDGEERESGLYPLSSGEETDGQSLDDRRPFKSRSCNFDAIKSSPDHQIDMHSQRAVTRAKSSQSRLMGIFRRNTMEETCHEQEGDTSVVRVSSLERAEMAADLLELQWSTNISDKKTRKDNDSNLSSLDKLDGKVDKDLQANNELSQASCAHDDTKNSLDQAVLVEETVSHYEQFDSSSKSDSEKLKCSVEEASAGVSCVRTHEKVVETSTLGESVLKEKCEVVSLISRVTDETCAGNADLDGAKKGAFCEITGPNSRVAGETSVGSDDPNGNANGVTSEIADSNSELSYTKVLDGCSSQQFLVEQVSNERDSVVLGRDLSQMDGRNNGVQSSIHCEMSDSSIEGTDNCSKQTYQTLDLGNEGSGKVCVHAKTLNGTTELPFEDNGIKQLMGDARLETELVELTENHCHQTNSSCSCTTDHNEDPKKSLTVTESFKQIIRVDPINGSVEEVKSHDICTTFNSSNTGQAVKGEEKVGDESFNTSIQYNLASSGDSPNFYGDSTSTKAMSSTLSQSSDEEQFLFGDFDEDKLNAVQTMEPKSPDHMDKDYHSSFRLEGTKEHKSVSTSYESYSSLDKYMLENPSVDTESSIVKSRVMSSAINVPMSPKTPGEGVGRLGESVPNMWFRIDNFDNHSNACHPLSHSLDASPKSLKWTLLSNDDSNCLDSDTEEEEQLTKKLLNNEDSQISGEPNSASASPAVGTLSFGGKQKIESEGTIAIDRVEKPNEGETPKARGRWRLWPFTFISSRPVKAKQPASGDTRIPDAEDTTRITASIDESRDELIPKGVKKMYRALTPTSEQLLSLNLSEGRNTITFTFSTGMLGNQQVDARIYLWKWNTRIVISDVDGTITKSDVLGQFMPMVGIDWCQTGVTHLFSAIKENGYQLLFLSARAIAQAYHTRQFLLNIKQDGKALPDGPIVISPDGLFPSLFREVIRRAPHEFKIACLEDIKSLFPSDINPFYAGFGNRDTDEISYLKVGIPKGKIFIINPKGEVAVNRRVDTKSYTSLHDLVHDMFPPTEPEQEDYNSWNFWKLPPPSLDM